MMGRWQEEGENLKTGERVQGHEIPGAVATRDPVCGMTVVDNSLRFSVGGRTFSFCGEGCLRRFREDTERFLGRGVPSREGP